MNTFDDESEEKHYTFELPTELKKKLSAFVEEIFPQAKVKILHKKYCDGIEKNDPSVIAEITRAVARSFDYGVQKPDVRENLGILQKELREWLVQASKQVQASSQAAS